MYVHVPVQLYVGARVGHANSLSRSLSFARIIASLALTHGDGARWCLFGLYRRGGCDHVRGIFCCLLPKFYPIHAMRIASGLGNMKCG